MKIVLPQDTLTAHFNVLGCIFLTAYPFMSLAFIPVLLFSVAFVGEAFAAGKSIGLGLIATDILATVKQ